MMLKNMYFYNILNALTKAMLDHPLEHQKLKNERHAAWERSDAKRNERHAAWERSDAKRNERHATWERF